MKTFANKKVLYVVGSLERGGCELHLLRILPKIKEHGFSVTLFSLSKNGLLRDDFLKAGIRVTEPKLNLFFGKQFKLIRRINFILSVINLALVIIRLKPDLIHLFLPASYWIGLPLGKIFSNAKIIMSRRSQNHYLINRPLLLAIEKKLHQKVDQIFANSKAVERELIEIEQVPRNKLRLFHNGIDDIKRDINVLEVRRKLEIQPHEILIVNVSNLIPYKGHLNLIVAATKLDELASKPWTMIVAGRDDGIKTQLVAECHKRGLQNKIRFIGPVDDPSSLIEAADICVLPSLEEGFANFILESMRASKPLVVTNVGGNPDAVEHMQNGLLVPARDPAKLGESLAILVEKKTLRNRFGKKSRLLYEQKFTLNQCVSQYFYNYKQILGLDSAE